MTDQTPLDLTADRVKLRVEDYLMLDEAGAFDPGRRTELLEGDVYYMSPQHRPHARILSRLYGELHASLQRLPTGLEAMIGPSILMPPLDVPEPDIVVTSEPDGDGLLPLESVILVVEVSDSTLRRDMAMKAGIYARSGVPEYWIVNVSKRVIHQFWSPNDGQYRETRTTSFGEALYAITVSGLNVRTDML